MQSVGHIIHIDINDAVTIYHRSLMQYGKIKRVIDGDTVVVVGLVGDVPMEYHIRVVGIDAPECKSKDQLERAAGLRVSEYVRSLLQPRSIVQFYISKHDKWGGRYIGDILPVVGYTDTFTDSLSQHLLQLGMVKPYQGAKKDTWTEDELSAILGAVDSLIPLTIA
jgi:endonuclease YncB( thermonuclease family)